MIIIVHTCILFFVILFNTSGIFCLILANKQGACNQMMILISLSSCNILLSILWVGDMLFSHFDALETIFYYRWWPFLAGIYVVWYMMMILLTLDRFVGCNFPLKHKIFVRKKVILSAIGSSWAIGLSLGIIGSVAGSRSLRPSVRTYGWPTLDIMFLLSFVVTYGSIFCVLARRRFTITANRNSDQSQFILTVTALLVCFLALEAIPSLVSAFTKSHSETFEKALLTIYKANLLFDPLIYIFLQRKVRNFAIVKVRSFCAALLWRNSGSVNDVKDGIDSTVVQ